MSVDVRTEMVDRVAEALFVRWTEPGPDAARCKVFATLSYDWALIFYGERERRRGEWQRQRESENPHELQNHAFQPAQGDPDTCLVCAKRLAVHPIAGAHKEESHG